MATREQNEKEYRNWLDLPDGGRRDRKGKIIGWQRMVKTVDAQENTTAVVQEIYSDAGELIERHLKFPQDSGHQVMKKDES